MSRSREPKGLLKHPRTSKSEKLLSLLGLQVESLVRSGGIEGTITRPYVSRDAVPVRSRVQGREGKRKKYPPLSLSFHPLISC